MRTKDLIGRIFRNLKRHGVTTSDHTDEDVLDALNAGQNHIISEINPDKIITIELQTGISSYNLTTTPEEIVEENTTMANFINNNLVGNKNGTNIVFSYPTMPVVGSEIVFFNGIKLKRDVDYTIVYDENNLTAIITLITVIPTSVDYLDSNYVEREAA